MSSIALSKTRTITSSSALLDSIESEHISVDSFSNVCRVILLRMPCTFFVTASTPDAICFATHLFSARCRGLPSRRSG